MCCRLPRNTCFCNFSRHSLLDSFETTRSTVLALWSEWRRLGWVLPGGKALISMITGLCFERASCQIFRRSSRERRPKIVNLVRGTDWIVDVFGWGLESWEMFCRTRAVVFLRARCGRGVRAANHVSKSHARGRCVLRGVREAIVSRLYVKLWWKLRLVGASVDGDIVQSRRSWSLGLDNRTIAKAKRLHNPQNVQIQLSKNKSERLCKSFTLLQDVFKPRMVEVLFVCRLLDVAVGRQSREDEWIMIKLRRFTKEERQKWSEITCSTDAP